MPLTDDLRRMILRGGSAGELKSAAMKTGMRTLRQAAVPESPGGGHHHRGGAAGDGAGPRRRLRRGDPMALYRWKGRNREGRLLRGELEAADPGAVMAELRRRRIQPLPAGIREKGAGLRREIAIPGLAPRVGADDVVMLTRNFAVMIEAGVTIVECLQVLADQTENEVVRKALQRVRLDVSNGMTLTDAMSRHPRLFDTLFVRMVAAGRARRRPARDPRPPGAVHRAVRTAQAQGQDRHGLSRHHRRRVRGGGGRCFSCT